MTGDWTCPVSGCTKQRCKPYGRYCTMHAKRLHSYGSLEDPPQTARYKLQQAALERLRTPEAFTPGECWEWPGPRQDKGAGYGLVAPSLRVVGSALAHRNAYSIAFGEIPVDMFACHHCDNRPCYRPSHLFAGTAVDNMRDMVAKGRGVQPFVPGGVSARRAAFTLEQVAEIVRLRELGWRQREIGAQFGVGQTCISKLLRGRTQYLNQLEAAS